MQGTQYATKRSILCRGAFCGPTVRIVKLFSLFLIQNMCAGYSKEPSQ